MSKEDMIQARELIKQKRYDEARAILRATSHPKAPTWLEKLDELDPPKAPTWLGTLSEPDMPAIETVLEPTPAAPTPVYQPKIEQKKEERDIPLSWAIGCLGLALLAAVCTIGSVWVGSRALPVVGEVFEQLPTAKAIAYNVPMTSVLTEETLYFEIWSFQATAGDRVTITMRSSEFDTVLALYDSDGDSTADDDDSGGGAQGTDSQIVITIPEDGRYTIIARQFELEEGGTYTLSVQKQ